MITLKLIKKTILNTIVNNLNEVPKSGEAENKNPFKGDALKDLKQLKAFIDDGKIDSREAQIINRHLNDIENEARDGLKEIAYNMLEEGFSAKNENSYNSFKALIEKSTGVKLPKWQDISNKISEFIEEEQINNFTIFLQNNSLKVQYKGWIKTFDFNLKEIEQNFDNQNHITPDLLDDNIQELQDIQLLNQIINTINNYDINGKTKKDFEDFIIQNYNELIKIKGKNYIDNIFEKHLKQNKKIGDLVNKKLLEIRKQNTPEKNSTKEPKTEPEKEKTTLNQKEKLIKKAIEWYKGKPKKSIRKLQTLINEHSLSIPELNPIKIDGIIGKQTISAIMDFQKKNGLVVDGIAGKNTLQKLGFKNPENFYNNKKHEKVNKNETRKNNKSETTNPIIEKQDNIEIKYKIDKKDVIQAAMKFLKENSFNSINTQAPIGTYTIDGETHNIVLKGEPGNYTVELNGSGIIDDYDQKVLGNTVEDITKAINQLITNYQKKLKQEKGNNTIFQEGENTINQGINYISNLFDGNNEKNINPEFNKIIEKLKKDGIIGKTTINIDSGDYKGDYELTFKIEGDKLILDSAWNQPGTDKEVKIDIDKVVGKTNDQIMEYINSLKNKLIKEYKEQVKKQKKETFNIEGNENPDF